MHNWSSPISLWSGPFFLFLDQSHSLEWRYARNETGRSVVHVSETPADRGVAIKLELTFDNVRDIGVQRTDDTVYVYAYQTEGRICLELTKESASDLIDQLRHSLENEPTYTSGAHNVNRGAW